MSAARDTAAPVACAAALASLPDVTPGRLAALLRDRTPTEAWAAVRAEGVPEDMRRAHRRAAGGGDELADRWRAATGAIEPAELLARHAAAGVRVLVRGLTAWPDGLDGLDPPVSVLFALGDLDVLEHRRVALVGTRRATPLGREIAREFGTALAAAGVSVVSGLAWGIDAAAHLGVIAAAGGPPLAVVGSGLDVPYPKVNTDLWHAVAATGLILSEHPLGARPRPHHFPLRNRILAALAEVVVVVESHARGGALITAELAMALGRGVAAVPGSLRNPAAAGANALLRDGATPVLDPADVLVALGLGDRSMLAAGPELPAPEQLVLDHLGDGATVDEVASRTGAPLDEVVAALDRLDERGLIAPEGAKWTRSYRSNA